MKKLLATLALSIALWGMISLASRSGEPEGLQEAEEEAISVVFVPQERATLTAEVLSTVQTIQKELGQPFVKGEMLLQLDKEAHEANRDKAQAHVGHTQSRVESLEKLLRGGNVSKVEVSEARFNLALAKAELVTAQKQLAACTIQAPYDGRVARVFVNRFEAVQPGVQLMEIVNDRTMRARFFVPSSLWGRVKIGQTFTIQVQETGTTVSAKVSHVGAVIDPTTSAFEVLAAVDNADQRLRSGMQGRLNL